MDVAAHRGNFGAGRKTLGKLTKQKEVARVMNGKNELWARVLMDEHINIFP